MSSTDDGTPTYNVNQIHAGQRFTVVEAFGDIAVWEQFEVEKISIDQQWARGSRLATPATSEAIPTNNLASYADAQLILGDDA